MSQRIRVHARVLAAACALLASGLTQARAQDKPTEWESGGRSRAYLTSLVGPGALLSVGVTTGIDEARDDPPEWGFGKRAASNMGRQVVQETVRHGLAAALSRSVVYQPCECNAFIPRVAHAFVETVTDRSREGKRMVAISRFAGAYAGAAAEAQWRPDRSSPEILATATSAIIYGGIGNLWREFIRWP